VTQPNIFLNRKYSRGGPHCNKILLEPKKELYKQKKKESKQKRLYKPEQGEKQNLAKDA